MTRSIRRSLLFGLGIALVLVGPAHAQDEPVHATVQSVSEETVTAQLKVDYRVKTGTATTFGQKTVVEKGEIRVETVSGRSVTAASFKGRELEGQSVRFSTVEEAGTLVVNPRPRQATVSINQNRVVDGAIRTALRTGTHTLNVQAVVYTSKELTVQVRAGETTRTDVKLVPHAGDATVVAESQGFLYRKTLNRVTISVPSAQGPYRLESSTGKVVRGREITLSPSEDEVSLKVYSGERYLAEKAFDVIDPPRPQIRALDAKGEELDIGNGNVLPRARPVIKFEAKPDAGFARRHPEDASYQVKSAKVSIRKGLKASQEIGTFDLGSNSTLKGELIRGLNKVGAQPKDRLIIQIEEVVRINHAGDEIPVDLGTASLTWSFILA